RITLSLRRMASPAVPLIDETRRLHAKPPDTGSKTVDSYQHIDDNQSMNRVALITGATRNLGFSLAEGLAQRLEPTDTVYLTGRDPARVAESVHRLSNAQAEVRGELLDVAKPDAVERFADLLVSRHGGVDIVFSNH